VIRFSAPSTLIALLLVILACSSPNSSTAKKQQNQAKPPVTTTQKPPKSLPSTTGEIAIIETNLGKITLRFYPEVAPNHVKNFKNLARSGFYNGTKFHRVIPGFMIQGGDPNTKDDDRSNDGTGGSGKNIKAEFNNKSHIRGTLSMARSAHPDSASSQFFIGVAPAPNLDGKYSIFGEVTDGLDVVDKIVSVKTDARNNPLKSVVMQKVTIASAEKPKKSD